MTDLTHDEWKPAKSLDSVRGEIRNAIFHTQFAGLAIKHDDDEEGEERRQQACRLLEFGVNSGLLAPDEGNDWLDAIWDRRPLATVAKKYMKDAYNG